MSRKKSAEQKLVEAVKELGLIKASSIFKVLEVYNQQGIPISKKRMVAVNNPMIYKDVEEKV